MGIVSLRWEASAIMLCVAAASGASAALELGPEDASGSWVGIYEDTQVGAHVRGVGDVDGDGYGDFLVGGYNTGGEGPAAGRNAMRLLLGSATTPAMDVSVQSAAGASFLSQASNGGNSPFLVHAGRAGDINNDGIDDMLMGADGPTAYAYAVFGRANRSWGTDFDLENAADFKVTNLGDVQVARVSGDVDFNGDGIDDFVVRNTNGIWGYHGGQPLSSIPAFTITGSPSGTNQFAMGVGDLDGNGKADVVGCGFFSPFLAPKIRLHGKNIAPDGWSGTLFSNTAGIVAREHGDFDGDGFDEILYTESMGPTGAIFGRSNYPTGVFGDTPLDQVTWSDSDPARRLGYGAQWLGDINGDGCDDFVTWLGPQTYPFDGLTTDDYAYIVLGSTTRPTGQQLVENSAIRIGPFQGFPALREHLSATDWNGDGLMDILIGAGGEDNGDIANAGKVFIYLAGDYPAATWYNHVRRTVASGNVGDFGPSRAYVIPVGAGGPFACRVAYTDRAPESVPKAIGRMWEVDPGTAPSHVLSFLYTDDQFAEAGVDESTLVLLSAPAESGPWTRMPFPVQTANNSFSVDAPQTGKRWWAIGAVEPAPEHWIIE